MSYPRSTRGFTELSRVQLGANRFLVVSERAGRLSIAQMIETSDENGEGMNIFMRNAVLCSPSLAKEIAQAITLAVGIAQARGDEIESNERTRADTEEELF